MGARPTARCDYSPIRERRMPFDHVRRQSFSKGLTFVQLWRETVKDDSALVAVAAQNQVLFGRSASDHDLHNLVRKPWEMEPDLDADRFQEEAKRNCFRIVERQDVYRRREHGRRLTHEWLSSLKVAKALAALAPRLVIATPGCRLIGSDRPRRLHRRMDRPSGGQHRTAP